MKRRCVAASMGLVFGLGALGPAAMAQTAEEAGGSDEFLDSLAEEKPEEAGKAKADDGAPADPAPADASLAKEAEATAPAPPAPAKPLDVIPVAQQAAPAVPAAPAPPRKRGPIEEIIVTAQRREENAQDVAISITVFNQEQLANANVTNASDLAIYTPSLTTNQRFGPENTAFAIRGFTQDLRTTASVGTYFAEVVAPRGQILQTSGDGAGPGALFDLQNVQVLKGPQGTLFGRNTTGGAVLLVPNKPKDEFEGYAELSGGDFEARRLQAVLNVPVTDWFKLRFGVDRNEREGHLTNITHVGADHLGDVDYAAYRLSLVLDLTDSLENYSIFAYVDSHNHGNAGRLFACNPSSLPTENTFFALVGRSCQEQLANQAASGQDGYYDLVSTIGTPISTIEEKRFINTTTWTASDNLTFKNIFAYAYLETNNGSDIFGSFWPETAGGDPRREFSIGLSVVSPYFPTTLQQTVVEEIQVQGSSLDERLVWQAGAYYEHSTPDGWSGNNAAAFIFCEEPSIEGDPSQFNCNDPLNGAIGGVLILQAKTEYLNRAVYSQATFDVLDSLSLTAGLRYTWDRTEGEGLKTRYSYVGPVQQAPTYSPSSPTVETEAPTWLLDLNYRPIDGVMTYAKYIRGYRQGSANVGTDPGVDTFDAEKVDTYEIGAKTTFGGLVPGRFNFAVFYNDFTDMQLQAGFISPTAGPTTAIFNAGKARIQGLEAEAFFQPWEALSASLSYSYLDTELLEQDDNRAKVMAASGPVAGETFTPIAEVGDELPFAPDQTYVASVNYRLPLPEKTGEIALGVTYAYIGQQRATASSSSPFALFDPYSLLNLNLNWTSIFQAPLDLSVFATNVLDEEYMTFIGGTYNVLGFESRNVGSPRTIGARLKYRFGAAAE